MDGGGPRLWVNRTNGVAGAMDELIILHFEGRTTEEERRELLRWRSASPANEFRYQDLRAVWALTGVHHEVEHGRPAPAVSEVLAPRAEPAVREWRWGWALTAAAIAASLVLFGLPAPGSRLPMPGGVAVYQTGPNELLTAVLGDGSVARLAPNTVLRVRMTAEGREADMEGRAFFAVAHDPDRPFRVQTSEGDIQVLGTRFELDTARDQIRVMVVDGRVALTAGGEVTELGAGDLAEASREHPLALSRVESPEDRLDWMGSWMAFESTPLWRVAREVEVRLGVQVVIADEELGQRTFSGWFSERDRGQLLAMICRVAELTCTTEQGVVRMDY